MHASAPPDLEFDPEPLTFEPLVFDGSKVSFVFGPGRRDMRAVEDLEAFAEEYLRNNPEPEEDEFATLPVRRRDDDFTVAERLPKRLIFPESLREAVAAAQRNVGRHSGPHAVDRREDEIEAERLRVATAGVEGLSDKPAAILKRIDKRKERAKDAAVRPAPAAAPVRLTLSPSDQEKVAEEASARLAALLEATGKPKLTKRLVKIKGAEDDLTKWWQARRSVELQDRATAPSPARIAVVRALIVGEAPDTYSRFHARRRLDVINGLEAPGQPWHSFPK